jgi:putative ABC transport system substrate-binding protein
MRRIGLAVALVLGLTLSSLAVEAQQAQQGTRVPRVGFILSNAPPVPQKDRQDIRIFLEGLRERGWIDGQNIRIEWRGAAGQPERIPALVRELVKLPVDIIVANSLATVLEATRASRIPVVLAGGAPFWALQQNGLAYSIARPGGSVTGTLNYEENMDRKALQLLKEAAPKVSRIAYLYSPPYGITYTHQVEPLKLKIWPVRVGSPDEFEEAFDEIRAARVDAARVDGLFLGGSPFFPTHQQRIIEFAARERLPAISYWRGFADSGGLMSYGIDWGEAFRHAPAYVDKILKGAKPGDLPLEQPRKFEIVINMKTAKAPGLTIPQTLLLRADQVIE